jgi:dienelactone hydrolase
MKYFSGVNELNIFVENVSFDSEGSNLLGRIYKPNVDGVFPAVAICHGYPGDTKNIDLAEELAFNGIVTLIFFYAGAWGSEGTYSLKKLEASTRDAVEYLLTYPFVDQGKVGLLGHSMGAVPLSVILGEKPSLKVGVFMSPASDIRRLSSEDRIESTVSRLVKSGKGKLNGLKAENLRSELPWLVENMNPVETIKNVNVPVLIVVGSDDPVTTPERCKALYDAANDPKTWMVIKGADHAYSEHRTTLMMNVLEWLKRQL